MEEKPILPFDDEDLRSNQVFVNMIISRLYRGTFMRVIEQCTSSEKITLVNLYLIYDNFGDYTESEIWREEENRDKAHSNYCACVRFLCKKYCIKKL